MKAMILLASAVFGQVPTAMTVDQCYNQNTDTKFFCKRVDNGSVTSVPQIYDMTGWCCEKGSSDFRCLESSEFTCTLTKAEMSQPLWMTYWVGMSPRLCADVPSSTLEATLEW